MEELVLHVGMFSWKLSRHVIGFALKDLLYTIAALMLFCFIIHVIAVLRRDGFLFSDCFESLLYERRMRSSLIPGHNSRPTNRLKGRVTLFAC